MIGSKWRNLLETVKGQKRVFCVPSAPLAENELLAQSRELHLLLKSKTLRNYAQQALVEAYLIGMRDAAAETEMPVDSFPEQCPFTVQDVLGDDYADL